MAPTARLGRALPRDGTADLPGAAGAFPSFMHLNAWKKLNSANFVCNSFSEVEGIYLRWVFRQSRASRPYSMWSSNLPNFLWCSRRVPS